MINSNMNHYTEPVWYRAFFLRSFPRPVSCIQVSISTVDEFYNAVLWHYNEFLKVGNIEPIWFCPYKMEEIEDELILLIRAANVSTKLKFSYDGNHP